MSWLKRLAKTLRSDAHRREVDEELEFHMAMREQHNVSDGMNEPDAHRDARVRFGNPLVWRERVSEADLILLIRSVLDDLRFGLRQLARSPAFALTAAITLGLGIGANTAIFSIADAVLLKPLPYPGADRMVVIHERLPKFTINDSWPDYVDWQKQNDVFDEMTMLQPAAFQLNTAGENVSVPGASVTDSFFSLFGANLIAGRGFTSAEETPGAAPAAVVSYGFAQRHLGGGPNAIGHVITIDGQAVTVVGVMPRGFSIPWGSYDVYLPLGLKIDTVQITNRANHPNLRVAARLRPGVTLDAANAEMDSIMQRLGQDYPESNREEKADLAPMKGMFEEQARSILVLLLAATGLVLLLACANIANMSLARAMARQHEFQIRASLGAVRMRLFRQALIENLPIALMGGGGGIGLAVLMTRSLIRFYPEPVFRLDEAHLNGTVLLFAACSCLVCWLLFATAPAIAACRRSGAGAGLRTTRHHNQGSGQLRFRSALLAAEIAIALVVTVSTGLVLRSLSAVVHIDLGFEADHLLAVQNVQMPGAADVSKNLETCREVLTQLRRMPGVKDATAGFTLPLNGALWTSPYEPGGNQAALSTQAPWTQINVVIPGYFKTMGINLKSGRDFNDADGLGSAPVVVVNESMARSIAKDHVAGRPLYVQYAPEPKMQIVGVVADVKQYGLEQPGMPEVYLPATQGAIGAMDFVVRTSVAPDSLARTAAATVHTLMPNQPLPKAVAMDTYLEAGLGNRQFVSVLLSVFDCLALLLALIGTAGVVSYGVEQRMHEIGIRIALGAKKTDVLRMIVLGQTARTAAIGVGAGVAGALAATRLLASQLYHVSASDPLTYAGAVLMLVSATLVASYLPARRATKVNPVVALRCE
jgi:putative ABC transport system permease protein